MIAVIGTGITGLTVAWSLNNKRPIRVYEKHPRIGMAAFTTNLEWKGKAIPFDIPFRTIKPDYYPLLFRLYDKAGIETIPVDYSFRLEIEKESIFGFRAVSLFGVSFPLPILSTLSHPKGRTILNDLIRFYKNSKAEWQNFSKPASLLHFLKTSGYSETFIYDFLLPTFALVNTCKMETVASYPAESILSYHSSGYSYTPQRTAKHGTKDIADKLTQDLSDIVLGAKIQSIKNSESGRPLIFFEDGSSQEFEHIVITTQANQALGLLGEEFSKEKKALSYFKYESSDVVLHSEKNFFPKRDVSLLFRMSQGYDKPEVTLDLARILPSAKGSHIFQTWNPHSLPKESEILKKVSFERPVMDEATKQGIDFISDLHQEPERRVWLCGSYSMHGIPLLEAGAKSGLLVASKILKQELSEILN